MNSAILLMLLNVGFISLPFIIIGGGWLIYSKLDDIARSTEER